MTQFVLLCNRDLTYTLPILLAWPVLISDNNKVKTYNTTIVWNEIKCSLTESYICAYAILLFYVIPKHFEIFVRIFIDKVFLEIGLSSHEHSLRLTLVLRFVFQWTLDDIVTSRFVHIVAPSARWPGHQCWNTALFVWRCILLECGYTLDEVLSVAVRHWNAKRIIIYLDEIKWCYNFATLPENVGNFSFGKDQINFIYNVNQL